MTCPKPPKIICVDFDKTIADSDYPEIKGEMPGAREALQRFRDMGYRVVISSCRTCSHLKDIFAADGRPTGAESPYHKMMVEWLESERMPYDEVDDGLNGKVYADFYIDDKGVNFDGDWPSVVQFVARRIAAD